MSFDISNVISGKVENEFKISWQWRN